MISDHEADDYIPEAKRRRLAELQEGAEDDDFAPSLAGDPPPDPPDDGHHPSPGLTGPQDGLSSSPGLMGLPEEHPAPTVELQHQPWQNIQLFRMWPGQTSMNLSLQQKSFHQLLQHHVQSWTQSLPRCFMFHNEKHSSNNEHELIGRRRFNLGQTGKQP